eukprot:3932040-Rhodomonas_salina.1
MHTRTCSQSQLTVVSLGAAALRFRPLAHDHTQTPSVHARRWHPVSTCYLAPEILFHDAYAEKVDIWGAGLKPFGGGAEFGREAVADSSGAADEGGCAQHVG